MKLMSRWFAVCALLAGFVLAASPGNAQDAPGLDLADVGLPIRIGITTNGPDGPEVTSTVVDTVQQAVELIASAKAKPSTLAVGVSQPVTIDGSRDSFRPRQWALRTLKADRVWKKSTGSGVVVAVIDTGVGINHSDLKGHVLKGVDFVDRPSSARDENGHGTHVAGIISAVTNNGWGVAGLAHGAKILPVRVLDADGSGQTVDVAAGVTWAVKHGADVINMSLSSTGDDPNLRAAIAFAVRKNVVVVAAAGNDGCKFLLGSPTTYPAAYPNVVGVGSIDKDGSVSSFSNCGAWVDVVAPGGGIFSTMIRNSNSALGCAANKSYCFLSGTSMATPYAAAAAALSIARTGSGWSASTVRSLIETTADDVGSAGKDAASGSGLINPSRMVNRS